MNWDRRARRMRRCATCALAGMVFLTTACYEGSGPLACTDVFVYGITVAVLDADSGRPVADEATLTLQDGPYVETVTSSWDGRSLSGAGERAGTYDLAIERPGYRSWSRSGIVVNADECHVRGVSLDARLEPLP